MMSKSIGEMALDRGAAARVETYVPRLHTGLAFLCAALLALAPACGGKDKGAAKPGDGQKDPTGISGTDPGTTGNPNGPGNPDNPAGTAPVVGNDGDGADGPGGLDDGETFDEPEPAPKVEPPVVDISDEEAAKQVSEQLAAARAALRGKSDLDGALRAAKEALSIDANNVEAVVLMAHAYYYKKLYSTADVMLLRALSSPNKKISNRAQESSYLYYVRGLVYDATDRLEEAKLAYEKAHELDANHRGSIMNLGVHYIRDSRYAEAQALFEKLVGPLNVKTAAVYNNLGSSYRGRSVSPSASKAQRDEFLSKAETAYKRSINLDKNYQRAYYNLGLLYMDASPFPMGGKDLEELKRLEMAETYFNEYRALPGADITLVDEMLRNVAKAIKKEKKRLKKIEDDKKKPKDDDW